MLESNQESSAHTKHTFSIEAPITSDGASTLVVVNTLRFCERKTTLYDTQVHFSVCISFYHPKAICARHFRLHVYVTLSSLNEIYRVCFALLIFFRSAISFLVSFSFLSSLIHTIKFYSYIFCWAYGLLGCRSYM